MKVQIRLGRITSNTDTDGKWRLWLLGEDWRGIGEFVLDEAAFNNLLSSRAAPAEGVLYVRNIPKDGEE